MPPVEHAGFLYKKGVFAIPLVTEPFQKRWVTMKDTFLTYTPTKGEPIRGGVSHERRASARARATHQRARAPAAR